MKEIQILRREKSRRRESPPHIVFACVETKGKGVSRENNGGYSNRRVERELVGKSIRLMIRTSPLAEGGERDLRNKNEGRKGKIEMPLPAKGDLIVLMESGGGKTTDAKTQVDEAGVPPLDLPIWEGEAPGDRPKVEAGLGSVTNLEKISRCKLTKGHSRQRVL